MTSIYDTYGENACRNLRENFDSESIQRDIKYGERDIKDIQQFITEARQQITVIERTIFKRYIEVKKGKDYYHGKVEFSISVYHVPQVPGNERLRVYEHDDSRRFVGNDKKKEFLEYVRTRQEKYPDAELTGSGIGMIKSVRKVVQL